MTYRNTHLYHSASAALDAYISDFENQHGLSDLSLTNHSSVMTYRDTQYPSASAAVDAYISDFENRNPSTSYRRTVEDLLSPRSLLQLTAQRSLETGVRDTPAEARRYTMKKVMDESYQQIMRADVEMQKARELVKSSKLLSQSTSDPYLSPLPGSSIITSDQLSDITMTTDAMLHASAYPDDQLESTRLELSHQHGYGGLKDGRHSKDRIGLSLDSTSRGVLKQRDVNTLLFGTASDVGSRHLFDTDETMINSDAARNVNYKSQRQAVLHKVTFDSSLSSTMHASSHSDDIPTSHFRNRDPRYPTSSTTHDSTLTDQPSSVSRPVPSWIEEFEAPNRAPPSWIDDLETSGRPAPSWIQDVDMSGVNIGNHGNRSPHLKRSAPSPAYKYIEQTLQTNRPGNLRNLSTASELLMSSSLMPHLRTQNQSRDLKITDLDNASSSSSEEMIKSARKLSNSMYKAHNQRISERRIAAQRKSNHSSTDKSAFKHRSSKYKLQNAQLKPDTHSTNQKDVSRIESFTTDDLLRVSPTGRDFMARSSTSPNAQNYGSSDRTSHRYSMNRSPKVARKNSVRDRLARSQERTVRISAETKDTRISSNTDSLIYTPPRGSGEGVTKRSQESQFGSKYGRISQESQFGSKYGRIRPVNQTDGKMSRSGPYITKDERVKERARRILDKTETPKTRLQSSPSGEGTSLMPSLHTSPIAAGLDHARSFLTEDILEGDRSWERNLPSIKPPQPVQEVDTSREVKKTDGVLNQFLDDCLVTSKKESPRLTNGNQPGPVEALKNMLFTLQQITPDHQQEQMEVCESYGKSGAHSNVRPSASSTSTMTTTDFDEAPGGKSLQRAMQHLSKLKSLVYDTASSMDDELSSKTSTYNGLPLTPR